MTTQPRPTAEEEASFLLYSPHPQAAIAAALRKRDELYRLAWEECKQVGKWANSVPIEYRKPDIYKAVLDAVDNHDAARKERGLE